MLPITATGSQGLEALARDIAGCRLCDAYGLPVTHVAPLVQSRAATAELLLVGAQPDKADVKAGRPLSGAAGRRLLEWLVIAGLGATPAEAAGRCRLTWLARCHLPGGRRLSQAAQNCYAFLEREVRLAPPAACVTLGPEPLAALFGFRGPLEHVVGRRWTEAEFGVELFRILPQGCPIVPLPAPTPASPWLRRPGNAQRLRRALRALAGALSAPRQDAGPSPRSSQEKHGPGSD